MYAKIDLSVAHESILSTFDVFGANKVERRRMFPAFYEHFTALSREPGYLK